MLPEFVKLNNINPNLTILKHVQCSLQFCGKLVDIACRKIQIRKIRIINGDFSHIFVLVYTKIHVIIHSTIKKNTEKRKHYHYP